MNAPAIVSRGSVPAALVVFALSSVNAQGLAPSPVDEILVSVESCAAATGRDGVDETRLKDDGWVQSALSNAGKPAQTSLRFYGRKNVMLVKDITATTPACILMARVNKVADLKGVESALVAKYGQPFQSNPKAGTIFMAPGTRAIAYATTGTRERPSVRIAVGPQTENVK